MQNHSYQWYMRLHSQVALFAEEDDLQPGGPWPAAAQALLCWSHGGWQGQQEQRGIRKTPGLWLGSSPVWEEACCHDSLCCTTHVAKHVSPPSYAELLPGPQIKSKEHCDSSLFHIGYHCRLVFCHLGAWLLWGRMPGTGNNHHRTGTGHQQLSSEQRRSRISL